MSGQAGLTQAHALLQAGRIPQAEAACRHVLAQWPHSAAALHLLGLIRNTAGDTATGEQLLRQSISLEPHSAEFRANLAVLLRRLGRLQEAAQSYREALALQAGHRAARLGLVRTLGQLGQHAAAEAEARLLVGAAPRDAEAWSALAMTLSEQGRLSEAESAYRKAVAIDPRHTLAQHNLGSLLSRMDRAEEALAALRRAESLGVRGFELAFNYGRTLLQLYRFEEAERAFADAVALNPRHTDAQINLARVRYMQGDPDFARDIAAAAAAHADDPRLEMLFGIVLRRAGDLAGAERLLRDLLARRGPMPEVRSALAEVLHEMGRLEEAEREVLAAAAASPDDTIVIENTVAILLARGRADAALPYIRTQRSREPLEQGWLAYEATAARVLGDDLYHELYDFDRLVRLYELEPPPGWSSMAQLNAALIEVLNARHKFPTHPLDQSLRNGSQTARNLLTDPDPVIQAVLKAFEAPIERYRLECIGTDSAHPLSVRNCGPARITGAWSIQLRREGFHVNHFHPEGWISSAYYVSVPSEVRDEPLKSGWIKFGEPRFPVPGADPERIVQPRSGCLVLFPSYMWHGTNAIHGPEPRTTIAFDATPTRPS